MVNTTPAALIVAGGAPAARPGPATAARPSSRGLRRPTRRGIWCRARICGTRRAERERSSLPVARSAPEPRGWRLIGPLAGRSGSGQRGGPIDADGLLVVWARVPIAAPRHTGRLHGSTRWATKDSQRDCHPDGHGAARRRGCVWTASIGLGSDPDEVEHTTLHDLQVGMARWPPTSQRTRRWPRAGTYRASGRVTGPLSAGLPRDEPWQADGQTNQTKERI